ncbi:Aste57867_1274 [Aphanomyces stellatus]|uniref:Aste57867_1274 protein n=1 Tax=Aphanomyces stellatus TaxID=120398 RepID=A0A485K5W1_9STRA|nr:hypothetical protein As57867_001273 [Aphanomyces stellatus]VFT78493.1 Aste57867_1274 [Aphanomyces stellatus]
MDVVVPHLAILLDKLACFKGPPKRPPALKECLCQAIRNCRLRLLHWLVEVQEMDPDDIRAIVASSACGQDAWPTVLREYDGAMIHMLERHRVHFDQTFMLRVVSMHDETASEWTSWFTSLQTSTPSLSNADSLWAVLVVRFLDELAALEGGDVAVVIGRCLQNMVRKDRPPRANVLRNVYNGWQSMFPEGDLAGMTKKRVMEDEMFAAARGPHRLKLLQDLFNRSGPSLSTNHEQPTE